MQSSDAGSIEFTRRHYAEELCRANHIASPAILAAFSTVPRERFVGPGPWLIQGSGKQWFTEGADVRQLYRDALIVLDESKHLNNGQPSLWAFHLSLLDVQPGQSILHLGCGTGYYSAILADLTGPRGRVTAVEIDEDLSTRARAALEPWPNAGVVHGDGSRGSFDPVDVIVVSAGATHPLPPWLAALKPGGKLLFPLTPTRGLGRMAYLARKTSENYAAMLAGAVLFVDFAGAQDQSISSELARALQRDEGASVRSLRCDPHEKSDTCWLHGDGWCFSKRPVSAESPAPSAAV